MNTKQLTSLYWFCQTVNCGGFVAASLKVSASAPTLSRAVSQLEEQVGEKLLHRHAKQFQLTKAGEAYYEKFSPLFNKMDEEWLATSNQQANLEGDITVSCPEPFADFFLQPLAIEFMQLHPDVNIHIVFSSDTQSHFDENIDLAVATTPTNIPTLIQKTLFETELALAASPKYIEKYGVPSDAESLVNHHLLAGNTMPFWELKREGKTIKLPLVPRYSVNSLRLMVNAAKSGMGIGLIPKQAVLKLQTLGDLVQILPNVECPKGQAFLIWNDRKLIANRVVTFREMIIERLKNPDNLLLSVSSN